MRIVTIAKIPVRLHWSFIALVGCYTAFSAWTTDLQTVGESLLMGVALFGSVVLHEFGHAMAARYYGIKTRHITLFPFGGVAAIEQIPQNPTQEFVIAIAGPMVNGALVLLFLPFALITGWWSLGLLALLNGIMGVFNLLPAYPMDGGRVLRAFLSIPFGHIRATLAAMALGRLFALLFVVAGFANYAPSLVLVGVFLFVAIGVERRQLRYEIQQLEAMSAA
ncbi:MAG: Zn-dependent protease [Myxococcota bacterium]|jgi:Zn-dependent protease